jgi:hypothetical protein
LVGDSTITSRLPPGFPATNTHFPHHIKLISHAAGYSDHQERSDKLGRRPQRAYSTARDQLRAKTPPFLDQFPTPADSASVHPGWELRPQTPG